VSGDQVARAGADRAADNRAAGAVQNAPGTRPLNGEASGGGQPQLHRRSQLADLCFKLLRKLNRRLLPDRQRHGWDR